MKKKIIGIIICMLLMVSAMPITGQVINNNIIKCSDRIKPSEDVHTWIKTFGGTKRDYCVDIQQTSDGGYILVGVTESFGFSNKHEIWLIKIDAYGNKQWDKTFGGPYNDSAYAVIQTIDGGYAVLGEFSLSDYLVKFDTWLIKTDNAGDIEWDIIFKERIYYDSIYQTNDEGFILAGGISLTKIDKDGNEIWTNDFPDIDFSIYSVKQTTDGGYIVTGGDNSAGDLFDAFLIKTDSEGNKEWIKKLGSDMISYEVIQRADSGYTVIGKYEKESHIGYSYQGWMIRTDEYGEILSRKNYKGLYKNYEPRSIYQTIDGGYVLTGWLIRDFIGWYGNVWLAKTDFYGKIIWEKRFGGLTLFNLGLAVQQTTDNGFIIGGITETYDSELDMIVIKTDSNGNVPRNRAFNRPLPLLFERLINLFPILKLLLQRVVK